MEGMTGTIPGFSVHPDGFAFVGRRVRIHDVDSGATALVPVVAMERKDDVAPYWRTLMEFSEAIQERGWCMNCRVRDLEVDSESDGFPDRVPFLDLAWLSYSGRVRFESGFRRSFWYVNRDPSAVAVDQPPAVGANYSGALPERPLSELLAGQPGRSLPVLGSDSDGRMVLALEVQRHCETWAARHVFYVRAPTVEASGTYLCSGTHLYQSPLAERTGTYICEGSVSDPPPKETLSTEVDIGTKNPDAGPGSFSFATLPATMRFGGGTVVETWEYFAYTSGCYEYPAVTFAVVRKGSWTDANGGCASVSGDVTVRIPLGSNRRLAAGDVAQMFCGDGGAFWAELAVRVCTQAVPPMPGSYYTFPHFFGPESVYGTHYEYVRLSGLSAGSDSDGYYLEGVIPAADINGVVGANKILLSGVNAHEMTTPPRPYRATSVFTDMWSCDITVSRLILRYEPRQFVVPS